MGPERVRAQVGPQIVLVPVLESGREDEVEEEDEDDDEAQAMTTLIVREFVVNRPLDQVWGHLSRIEEWPSWAGHIKQIDVQPPGELGPKSVGVIHLTSGIQSAFRVTEFNPPRSWKWVGPILWLTIAYDHQFEAEGPERTRLTWIVQAEGFGSRVLGRLYAEIYRRNMEKAVSRLTSQMNSLQPPPHPSGASGG